MKLTLSTYNGTDITGYKPSLPRNPATLIARIISVFRTNDTIAFGGKSFEATEFDIWFTLAQSESTFHTQLEAIGTLFDPRDGSLRTLVALDANDSNRQYYLQCTPMKFLKAEGRVLKVHMWAADPVWKKVTASTKQIAVTAGAGTDTVANGGNVDAYPTITVMPTTGAGEYAYRRHIIVYNPLTVPFQNYPLDVTDGGFDTAALVADSSVSNQINQVGGIAADATTIPIDTSVGGGLAASGTGYVDSEQIAWTGNSGGNLTGVTRGLGGTTAATHADNAVIKRSLIMADGRDIRLLDGGTEIERWPGAMNGSNTLVWAVLDLPAGGPGILQTAVAASGVTTMVFQNTQETIKWLRRLPPKGIVYCGTEAIAYTAKNMTNRRLTIADTGRAIKDTSAAIHPAGSSVYWLPFDLVLAYGNTSADAPDQTDLHKPCFSLDNSSNTNWRYDSADSVFADEAGLRAGGFKPAKPKGSYSDWYTGNQGTFGTDPATDMGAEIVSYQVGALYKAEQARIEWTLYNPAGFTSISSIGEKYKIATNTPWPKARLRSSKDGIAWVIEWTEGAPASAATWTAWTHASEAVPAGSKYLQFVFVGAVNAVADAQADFEVGLGSAGSMGVSMESTGVPQVTLMSQQSNCYVDFTLTNSTTGDVLSYKFPLAANHVLTFDTEDRTVTYQDRLLSPPDLSSVRQEWLRLAPGNNTIVYADASGGDVTVDFSWNDRKNV